MRNIFLEIKWAYQRVRYGFDDRIYWGFDSYFIQIIPALKTFCENELALPYIDLNPTRKKVFEDTVALIEKWDQRTYGVMSDQELSDLLAYVGQHISYYWN